MQTDIQDHFALIYVIGTHDVGPVKIGMTTQIPSRLAALQAGNPLPLSVYAMRFAVSPPSEARKSNSLRSCLHFGACDLERETHKKLEEFGLRLMGEWFDISADDAVKVIQKVGERTGVRAVGLDDLAGADLDGRSDAAMAKTHMVLLHEAYALQSIVSGMNDRTCKTGNSALEA